jgi:hypothetical protein
MRYPLGLEGSIEDMRRLAAMNTIIFDNALCCPFDDSKPANNSCVSLPQEVLKQTYATCNYREYAHIGSYR